ncbi:MAG: putative metallopeptidase [Patescibacteria group bacterium]
MQWEKAKDIEERINKILKTDIFPNINGIVTALRGFGSSSRAIARIWSFPRPWQLALSLPPQYIIEVISERFDKLTETEKDKVIIHELMHIPKGFSGALVAHRNRGRKINSRNVDIMYDYYFARRG